MSFVDTLQKSQHGTWIEIRLSHLTNNLEALCRYAPQTPYVMAIVKANAYGHGLIQTAKALSGQVTYFAVSSLKEAMNLKEHQITRPVFILGRLFGPEIHTAVMNHFTLSVSSFEEAREISEISSSFAKTTSVHIKVDTGMGRLGIPYSRAVNTLEKIHELKNLKLEGLYTHFPTAESNDGFSETQLDIFADLLRSLKEKGIHFEYRHAANSAGILKRNHEILNMMRPGLMLYGIYPDPSLKSELKILPALTLKSRAVMVKRLNAGATAGYGRNFKAEKPVNIAVFPVGYSHGYPFPAWSSAEILHRGKRYQLAGRISMDYMTINFNDDLISEEDEITLIGENGGDRIRVEDVALWSGTIPYEIVTRLLPSIPRFYH
ncbi:MAG: alanine racemase [Candidatus Omnitrophica bacterium]|nr:alanine racemase [Candidatus Omnitrophota bacterium]